VQRPYQSLTGRPRCMNAPTSRRSYVPVWHRDSGRLAQPTTAVRISLKPTAPESLTEWMFEAPETAVPTWAPSRSLRYTADSARLSASGVYPALQGNADVTSQGPQTENVATVADSGDGLATRPSASGSSGAR